MPMTPLTLLPSVFLHKRTGRISGYSKTRSCSQRDDGCLKSKALTPKRSGFICVATGEESQSITYVRKWIFFFQCGVMSLLQFG